MLNRALSICCVLLALGMLAAFGQRTAWAEDVAVQSAFESAARLAVNRRIRAFNRHDLKAYLDAHHPNVRIYVYPDRLLGQGRSHLRRIFEPNFQKKDGRIDVIGQFVVDNFVVSDENLVLGDTSERLVSIYEVVQGRVASLRLIEARHRK
ncbi:MAG: nuclear transport factor 2 family protein [Myxococcota bacterium]